MIRRFLLIVFTTVLVFGTSEMQAQYVVTKEDRDRAAELKEEYEDDVIALDSKTEFSFEWSKKHGLTAQQFVREEIMCLKEEEQFGWYTIFDEQSSVDRMEAFYPDGDKDERSSFQQDFYQSDMYFYTDAMVGYITAYFNKEGERRFFEYNKTYTDVKYLTSVYFPEHYPIYQKEVSFTIPRWMEVELLEMNFDSFDVDKTEEYLEAEDADKITYTIKTLEGAEAEYASPGPSHIRPHLLVLCKSYEQDGVRQTLFSSADDLYGWYSSLVQSLQNDGAATKALVDELVAGKETDEERIKAIYYWVQHNIRYIAFEDGIAGFKPDESHQVFEKKYGDCKGMANLTKEMLRSAGFDARLAWLGTKRLKYDYSIPSMAVDNHMICAVQQQGTWYFLDPTEKFGALGEYSERIQGKEVMIEDGSSFIIQTVPSTSVDQNLALIKISLHVEGNQLEGVAEHIYKGESKTFMLSQLERIEAKNLELALHDFIGHEDKNFSLKNLITSNLEQQDSILRFSYGFTWENAVSAFGSEIYLDLDFNKDFQHYEMKEERKNDFVFDYKMKEETQIELEIPEGYTVSYVPLDLEEVHPDFSFIMRFNVVEQKLLYTKEILINEAVVRKKDFTTWNSGVKELIGRYSEQIGLSKP